MARDENMPFDLGQTYFNGDTETIDANVGRHLEGQEYWVEDNDYSSGSQGAQAARSHRKRKVRVVRNASGVTIARKSMCKLKTDGTLAAQYVGQVSGLCQAAGDKGYPADEWLGTGGVKANDLFYVVVDGLATVISSTTGSAYAVGEMAVPAAAGQVVEGVAATGTALASVVGLVAQPLAAAAAIGSDLIVDVNGHNR